MEPEKLFEVRPRMEGGGTVVVEVVKTDDGATLANISHGPDLSAYQGVHALKEGLEAAFARAYQAGYAQGVHDITQPPKEPDPAPVAAKEPEPAPVAPTEPAPAPAPAPAEAPAPATEPEGKPQP